MNKEIQVYTTTADFPIQTLRDNVESNDLKLNPNYQREYVFSDVLASRLVESVLLNIPIPVLYFSEEDDSTYSVIDGQQRVTSLVNYVSNKYPLKGLETLEELNTCYYKDLEKPLQRKLMSSSLKTVIIQKASSNELVYEIFSRLNQGSVKLNPQELRNCLYYGPFNELLKELASHPISSKLLVKENYRYAYEEKILRLFTAKYIDSPDLAVGSGAITKRMNKLMSMFRDAGPDTLSFIKKNYLETMDVIHQIFGEYAFCPWDEESKTFKPVVRVGSIKMGLFDSIGSVFSTYSKQDLLSNADEIRDSINNIKIYHQEYNDSLNKSYKASIQYRKSVINGELAKIIGHGGGIDEPRAFSKDLKEELYYDGYICPYCKKPILSINDAEIDHIIPYSLGGKTDPSNAQLLHKSCNRAKSNNPM